MYSRNYGILERKIGRENIENLQFFAFELACKTVDCMYKWGMISADLFERRGAEIKAHAARIYTDSTLELALKIIDREEISSLNQRIELRQFSDEEISRFLARSRAGQQKSL